VYSQLAVRSTPAKLAGPIAVRSTPASLAGWVTLRVVRLRAVKGAA
jgi:hypothetical protein